MAQSVATTAMFAALLEKVEHLASTTGTKKEKVNSSSTFNIGACCHGEICFKLHKNWCFTTLSSLKTLQILQTNINWCMCFTIFSGVIT